MPARLLISMILTAVLAPAAATIACDDCPPVHCEHFEIVEKTVMVPEWTTKIVTVPHTLCRPETRERTVTVYHRITETKQIQSEYTVMVAEERTSIETRTFRKPVWETETEEYTVMVPHQEKRQGTHEVCKMVPVTETRTVCEDQGNWDERICETLDCTSCCAKCGDRCINDCGCNRTSRFWVPKIVERQVKVTVLKPKVEQESYEYYVTVCKPETRTRAVKVCKYVDEEKTRKVTYTAYLPQKMLQTHNVTTYKCVPEERVEQYTVMVPYTVEREVPLRRCTMVPKTVTCKVRVCCDSCCGHHRRCDHG